MQILVSVSALDRPAFTVWGLSAVRDAETAEPIELPFGLWTPVGRRKQSFIVFATWRQCAHIVGHTGGTWRIRLNCPSAAAMRSFVKLL